MTGKYRGNSPQKNSARVLEAVLAKCLLTNSWNSCAHVGLAGHGDDGLLWESMGVDPERITLIDKDRSCCEKTLGKTNASVYCGPIEKWMYEEFVENGWDIDEDFTKRRRGFLRKHKKPSLGCDYLHVSLDLCSSFHASDKSGPIFLAKRFASLGGENMVLSITTLKAREATSPYSDGVGNEVRAAYEIYRNPGLARGHVLLNHIRKVNPACWWVSCIEYNANGASPFVVNQFWLDDNFPSNIILENWPIFHAITKPSESLFIAYCDFSEVYKDCGHFYFDQIKEHIDNGCPITSNFLLN